jgi:hypothetical protein
MTKGRCSYAVSVLAGLGLLALSGCGQNGRTPTSPEPLTSASAASQTAAAAAQPNAARPQAGLPEAVADESRGNGSHGNGGHGNGGGHHGPGGGTPGEVHLSLAIQPDVWNTNYPRSHGTVTARISGSGLAAIDLGSIMLVGTGASAAPLAPRRVQRVGNHVQAFFGKADAFATLDHPKPGDQVTVTIQLTAGGAAQTLTDMVRIVGPAETST